MPIQIKIHEAYRNIVSAADANLIGKKFIDENSNLQLDVKESFYGGDLVEEPKAIKIMKAAVADDATFNVVGEQSIQAALKAGIIEKRGIMRIKGIPHALGLL
jgi:hypothetical protein